ncbi:MAG: hypothetical protein Q9213_005170 [Squamulea squamosa]
MSEPTTLDVDARRLVTAEDYYACIKTAVGVGDIGVVKSKLSQWWTDTSVAGPTPEHINYLVPQAARGNGQPEILELLLSLGGKIGPHTIALARSLTIFRVFVAHGWEVDDSLLRSHAGNSELVALFLAQGANPNSNGPRGFSPLDIAALHGTLETVKLLFGCGASLEPNSGALHAASQGDAPDRIPIMAYLVKQGANINGLAIDYPAPSEALRSGRKGTPLHTATKWANEEAKAWLLGNGADPKAKNELGETPEEWGKRFDNDGPERGLRLRRALTRKRKAAGA